MAIKMKKSAESFQFEDVRRISKLLIIAESQHENWYKSEINACWHIIAVELEKKRYGEHVYHKADVVLS